MCCYVLFFFVFKQKTAYERRISDWSSDVCSSDLTGLHHYRWSREKAIAYYNDSLGTPEGSNVTEIERYCVWPGQATSYMVGQTRWVAIREKAKATLGDKFDLRAFHDTALSDRKSTPLNCSH